MGETEITVVYSPKSGVSLLDLGDFESDMRAAHQRTMMAIEGRAAAYSNNAVAATPAVTSAAGSARRTTPTTATSQRT